MNIVLRVKKLHSISRAPLNLGDGRFCIQLCIELCILCIELCIETLCKRATSVAHFTNFSFEFCYEIFTEDASLLFLYHGAKKSKMARNSNQGGPALIVCGAHRPTTTRGNNGLWSPKAFGLAGQKFCFSLCVSVFVSVFVCVCVVPVLWARDRIPRKMLQCCAVF